MQAVVAVLTFAVLGTACGSEVRSEAGPDSTRAGEPASSTTEPVSRPSVVATIEVGTRADEVAATETAVWITNGVDGTLTRIDPVTNVIESVVTGLDSPDEVAATDEAVWVTSYSAGSITEIDPDTNEIVGHVVTAFGPRALTAVGSTAWFSDNGTLSSIDSGTGLVQATNAGGDYVSATNDAVFVADNFAQDLTRVDPESGVAVATTDGVSASGLTATDDAVWVGNSRDGTTAKLDPSTMAMVSTVDTGGGFVADAIPGSAWVINHDDDTVSRVDAASVSLSDTIEVDGGGYPPFDLAATAGAVWVTFNGGNTVARIDPGSGGAGVGGPLDAAPAPSTTVAVDLAGTYAIAGRDDFGSGYGGSAVITSRGDGTYDIEWTRTDSSGEPDGYGVMTGTGSLSADVLTFEFTYELDGFVEEGSGSYTLGPTGQLVGSSSDGFDSWTESLTPQ